MDVLVVAIQLASARRYQESPNRSGTSPTRHTPEARHTGTIALTTEEQDCRFEDFALPKPLLSALDDLGFLSATPIQSASLPYSLSDYDITGQAQTGTGKTAAFLITILTQQWERCTNFARFPGFFAKQSHPRPVWLPVLLL